MRISDKIAQADKEDRVWWSFEYFPPRTAQVSSDEDAVVQVLGMGAHVLVVIGLDVGSSKFVGSYRTYAGFGSGVY